MSEPRTIGEQWWLAELDPHGNPSLIDGAHSSRDGADQAKYLFDRLGFSGDRRLVVARVTLSEVKPSSKGVNEEALGALNSIGLRPQPADECDHDWEDMGDGTMACTYPDCNATRPKLPDDEEA